MENCIKQDVMLFTITFINIKNILKAFQQGHIFAFSKKNIQNILTKNT